MSSGSPQYARLKNETDTRFSGGGLGTGKNAPTDYRLQVKHMPRPAAPSRPNAKKNILTCLWKNRAESIN